MSSGRPEARYEIWEDESKECEAYFAELCDVDVGIHYLLNDVVHTARE
jgi:hypothetical protein